MADLTSVADVKAYLGLNVTTDDQLLARLVSAASAFAEQSCHRTFAAAAATESYSGNGGPALMLRRGPVTAVASVTIDGAVIAASTPGTRESGWLVADPYGLLVLQGRVFTRGVANVAVTYTAGYALTPPDLAQAVVDLVALKYKQKDRVGQTMQVVGNQTTVFGFGRIPADVEAVFARYRRVTP